MERRHVWIWIASAAVLCTVVFASVKLTRPSAPPEPQGPQKYAEIEHVYSGHKVKLDSGEELIYAGIRAPHPNEKGYEEALERNRELTEREDVRLRFDDQELNSKGQLVAYVSVNDGMVNQLLVREGLAYVRLTSDSRRFGEELLAAQQEARRNKRGVWARHKRLERSGKYPADPKYGNYHRGDCEETPRINPQRLVVFKTQAAALDEGYAPCSKCRP